MITNLITYFGNLIRSFFATYVRAMYHECPIYDDVTGEQIGTAWYTVHGERVHFTRDEPKTPRENINRSPIES